MWAENLKAYYTGYTKVGSSCTFDGSSYTWSNGSDNTVKIFEFSAGQLSNFSKIVFTTSSLSGSGSGDQYRIVLMADNNAIATKRFSSDGNKDVSFSDGWTYESGKSSTDLSSVNNIRFAGVTTPTSGSYSITLDAANMYLLGTMEGIASTENWTTFHNIVEAGLTKVNVLMTADVDAGSTMVGLSWDKSYKGTFDGAGHTLKFNYSESGKDRIAPFKYIEGATIKNLLTTGTISTDNFIAGIAADVKGTNNIICCGSNMNLTAANTSDCRVGGLVARCNEDGAEINFSYCLFNGKLSAGQATRANGFVGYNTKTVKTDYCLIAPTSVTNGNNTICGSTAPTANNTYYYYASGVSFNTNQGTAGSDNLLSGKLAYDLNTSNTGTLFFGQENLNKSNVKLPVLTSLVSKKVYKLTPYGVSTPTYVNSEGALPNPVRYGALGWNKNGSGDNLTSLWTLTDDSGNELYKVYNKYVLTVTSAGATTLMLPFDANLPSGVKAYDLTYTSGSTTLTATSVDKITANQPVLINAAAGNYTFNVSNSTEISYGTETYTNGVLTGVYIQSNKTGDHKAVSYVPANSYVLQNGASGLGFYKVAADNTIKITSFRAYLTASASAREFLGINFDEGASNIDQIEVAPVDDDVIYDLSGRVIEHPTKGIYVKNGKKFIVK